MLNLTDLQKLIEDLAVVTRQRDELLIKLNEIKAKKRKKAESAKSRSIVSPEDKMFNKIINSAFRRIKNQEHQDVSTIKRVLQKTIVKQGYSEYNFYTRFNNSVERLTKYETFVNQCGDLSPSIVAQNVVFHGDSAVSKVFKYGLITTFGQDKIRLMSRPIFSEDELKVEQYMPETYESESGSAIRLD